MLVTCLLDVNFFLCIVPKLDGVGPVDNRITTAEAQPICKIHPISKIAITLEPVKQFEYPLRFSIS